VLLHDASQTRPTPTDLTLTIHQVGGHTDA
jgi:hypothetical protein